MAELTGTIHEEIGGVSYTLRLTMRGIAALQAKYGKTISGLLDGTTGDIPDFATLLELVSIALQTGESLEAAVADEVADNLLTRDAEIVGRIVAAAFPDQKPGKRARKGKAA